MRSDIERYKQQVRRLDLPSPDLADRINPGVDMAALGWPDRLSPLLHSLGSTLAGESFPAQTGDRRPSA